MVKDTVQSLKVENDKLKEKVEEVFAELKKVQENLKGNHAGGHVASASDPDALKSLDFLSKEYDDLNEFRDRALDKISTLEKSLKQLSTEVSKVSMAIDQVQEYSYSYNIKLVGVPELEPLENAFKTSQLCSKIFNAIGVDVKPYDIDIAHRITPRHATERRPKPIICKFTRRLIREQVMARRREIRNVNPTSIGLQEDVSLDQVGIFDHLTPRLQSLLADAKKFKERCNYAFCWAKNSIVWLRKSEGSRPIAIKSSRDLDNLMSREQSSS